MKMSSMLERFREVCSEMFTLNDELLLAVSGGIDSMVMLNLFCMTEYRFAVAHCNFSLRGEESDGDTQLVVDFCKKKGVKLHTVRFDTYAEMARSGDSLQMAARNLRYDWFAKMADEYGYTKIAIAHNSGDTIETFFINLLRGTGVRGLAGISTVRDRIVRPIMAFSRMEIETFAEENGVVWRDDSSNSGTKYLRNKLRHIVLPQLREIEPDFDKVMLSDMERVTDAVSFMDNRIKEIKDKSFSTYRGRITVALSVVAQYKPFEFVLYELLSPLGFNAAQVAEIAEDVNSTRKFESDKYEALLSRGLFILSEREEAQTINDVIIDSFDDNTHGLRFELLNREELVTFKTSSDTAFFDADKIKLPLMIRSWRDGDSFVPFGMTGHKKLSDFFVDNKINLLDKSTERILTDANGTILWIIGRRSDNRFRVTFSTRRVLKVKS